MKAFLFLSMFPLAMLLADQPSTKPSARVAFAQYCFWTGEMELGQIAGVVRTEAGYFQGREVTLVDYDPARVSLESLAGQARKAGVADSVHFPSGSQFHGDVVAGVKIGAPLDRTYRTAPASDQKKQLEGTPFARLPLTPEQATKVNAFVRVNPARAREWLAPSQRSQLVSSPR